MAMPKLNAVFSNVFTLLRNGGKAAVQLALGREASRNLLKLVVHHVPPLKRLLVDRPAAQALAQALLSSGTVFLLALVEDQLPERKRKIVQYTAQCAAMAAASSAVELGNIDAVFDLIFGKDPLKEAERILQEAKEID